MPKGTGRWLAGITLALLLGCGGGEREPAEVGKVDPAPVTAPDDAATVPAAAPAPVVAPRAESEREGEPGDEDLQDEHPALALDARVEALLAKGTRPALRRGLRLLLEQREQADAETPDDPHLAEMAARVGQALIDWDTLALLHEAPVLAQRDLPLLRRWQPDDPRVGELAARLEQVQRIRALLDRAARLEAAGRLVGKGSDQAVAQLHEVLRLAPGHAGATRGLIRIEQKLVADALAAAQDGDFERAQVLLASAGKVRRQSAQVQNAAARVVEIREQQVQRQQAQIAAALAVGDVAAAKALLPRLDDIALDERAGAAARADIQRVQLYGAYDVGVLLVDPLASGGLGPGMVVIPAGEFQMGSSRSEADHQSSETPRHRVRFARGFAMARTETTVAQFRAFINATQYRTTAQREGHSMVYDERGGALVQRRRVSWKDDYAGRPADDDMPVLHVSWEDAQAYASWLAQETGMPYRLPSEAEFEYVLRAGSTTAYPWGDGSPPPATENLTGALDQSPTRRSWANAFEGYGDGYWGPAPVARFASNPFGLNDINGNVSEWVQDCWHDSYSRAPKDGSAWVNPGCREYVIRGGSWAGSPVQARSAFRLSAPADTVSARVGFRVARDL